MRSIQLTALVLGLFATTIIAQAPTSLPDVPGLSLDDNPPCAIPCLLSGLNQTTCPTNDQTCLCQDQEFITYAIGCTAVSCPLKSTLVTQNLTWTVCQYPLSNEVPKTKVVRMVLFAVLPTLSIILRIVVKVARLSTWGWDDYSILLAYAILATYVGMHFYLEENGAGRDLFTLTDRQITNFFKGFYVLQHLYHSCIDLIKASILFMYLRIFHLPDEKIRIVLWITQAVNLTNGLIFIFVGVFQCSPISLAWTFWTGETGGKCIDIVKLALAHAAINIGLDVWILILPLTQIWTMNLAPKKKFGIIFMFSLGLFLTIVSCIRVTAILQFRSQPLNPTVAMMPSVIWADIELYVGVFTACIPNLRQFFVRFILRKSEKKERLSSAVSGSQLTKESMASRASRKPPTLAQQLSEIDTMDDGHDGQDGSLEFRHA